MPRFFLGILLILMSISTLADKSDCKDMYVGRIKTLKGHGLYGVTFLNSPTSKSGSYWVWFTGWSESEKNAVLSLLMAAKFSQHRVNLITEWSDSCGIATGQRVAKAVILANNK